MKRHIPNIITLGNLFCGVMSIRMAVFGRWWEAVLFVFLGIVCDFLDGLIARLLHVTSPLGKELDSLADVVTSGVVPGFFLFMMLWEDCTITWLKYTAFLIPMFAAYRLAKFNLDERQHHSFLGLPTPANTLFWTGIVMWSEECDLPFSGFTGLAGMDTSCWVFAFCDTGYIVMALVSILLNILMISELPMFSLKFANLSWRDNRLRYIFLLVCLLLVVLFGYACLPMIVVWYVLLSLITCRKAKQ